jgi:hypothetical protein
MAMSTPAQKPLGEASTTLSTSTILSVVVEENQRCFGEGGGTLSDTDGFTSGWISFFGTRSLFITKGGGSVTTATESTFTAIR